MEDIAGNGEDEEGREAPETGSRGILLLGGPAWLGFAGDTGNVLALTESVELPPPTDDSVEVRILDREPDCDPVTWRLAVVAVEATLNEGARGATVVVLAASGFEYCLST